MRPHRNLSRLFREHSHLPQAPQRFQNPLDLLGASFVLAVEAGGEGFGGGGGIGGEELADECDLIGEAVRPGGG
jgi:hypothetical protein